ncbi:hypothetical protein GE09DRAFT_208638 [Coniochaeta sp. 2T2.1]|nr:hypothetical protein GE09DRAFT_208638 [Coniochaeta sp. 2T2.1]
MLRASCDRCHRDKVKCQFEPGTSTCVRCRNRRGRCVRSAPMPSGRSKSGTKSRRVSATITYHAANDGGVQFNTNNTSSGQQSPGAEEEAGGAFVTDPLASHAQSLVLARQDLDGSGWWDSPTLLVPSIAPWHLGGGNDYSQLSLFPEGNGSSTPAFPSGSDGSSTHHTAEREELDIDVVDLNSGCRCSVSLAGFLENDESHPCLSSDPSAFDVVLNTNRSIISAVRELAECWNPHPPMSMMVACLLVQSVLASVREAWWSSCRVGKQRVTAAAAALPEQQQTVGSNVGSGQGQQRVFVGSYGMDEEDSSVLRRQMVLLDLEKVKRTLCLLQERIEKEQDVEGIGSFVNKFLAAEVRRIAKRISEQEDP